MILNLIMVIVNQVLKQVLIHVYENHHQKRNHQVISDDDDSDDDGYERGDRVEAKVYVDGLKIMVVKLHVKIEMVTYDIKY